MLWRWFTSMLIVLAMSGYSLIVNAQDVVSAVSEDLNAFDSMIGASKRKTKKTNMKNFLAAEANKLKKKAKKGGYSAVVAGGAENNRGSSERGKSSGKGNGKGNGSGKGLDRSGVGPGAEAGKGKSDFGQGHRGNGQGGSRGNGNGPENRGPKK